MKLETFSLDVDADGIAVATDDGLRHDLRLQGNGETVFLAFP